MERSPRDSLTLRSVVGVLLVTGLLGLLMGVTAAAGLVHYIPAVGSPRGVLGAVGVSWALLLSVTLQALLG